MEICSDANDAAVHFQESRNKCHHDAEPTIWRCIVSQYRIYFPSTFDELSSYLEYYSWLMYLLLTKFQLFASLLSSDLLSKCSGIHTSPVRCIDITLRG